MPLRTKFSTERFGQVYNIIDSCIDDNEILLSDSKNSYVIQFEVSDKKYIKRIMELNMFPNIKIVNEFGGVWLINNNQKTK